MKGKQIVIIRCATGDWSAVYVDGRIETQGHDITEYDFIALIDTYKVFESIDCFEVSTEYMEELGGQFPSKLAEIDESNRT